MKSKHIYLNLFLIDFPLSAITSILHRVSGVILFFFIPFFLYFLKLSIESETSFIFANILLSKFYIKISLNLLYIMFLYHLINGIKHVIIDFGFFDDINSSKKLSLVCIFFVIIFYLVSVII